MTAAAENDRILRPRHRAGFFTRLRKSVHRRECPVATVWCGIERLESRRLFSTGVPFFDAPVVVTPPVVEADPASDAPTGAADPVAEPAPVITPAPLPDPAPVSDPTPVVPPDPAPVPIVEPVPEPTPEPAPLTRPSVSSMSPAAGATGVLRDVFVSTEVNIPNGGIDPAMLTSQSVYLYKAGGVLVPATLNTSGAGDVIVLHPLALLDANARYTMAVTDSLKDVDGNAFKPFSKSFTTGASASTTDTSIQFQKVALTNTTGREYYSLAMGPDGRLYAGTDTGLIVRWDVAADGSLSHELVIDSLVKEQGGPRFVVGLAFDPSSSRSEPILWISHTTPAVVDGPDWSGTISRLSGKNLSKVQDEVIHLPRSSRDHFTNQLAFGPDGALYFCQAGNSATGAPDPGWSDRPERLLSAAILRLDRSKLGRVPLDATTPDGGGAYDPYAPGAPLTIYATGVRNAYDLLWHSNGSLYAPANGSAAGGATPGTPHGYGGTPVPTLPVVHAPESDVLFKIEEGAYYGHPDPARDQYTLDGGNPTAGADPYEVPEYPVGTLADPDYQPPIFDFSAHQSPDGVIEYRGSAFGGRLDHTLIVLRYSGGDDAIVLKLAADGNVGSYLSGMKGMTGFENPIDLVEQMQSGNLYVSELGNSASDGKITLLRPVAIGLGPAGAPPDAPRTPVEKRLIKRISHYAQVHALPVPDLSGTVGQGLKDAMTSLQLQAARNILADAVAAMARKTNYPLPPLDNYSADQLRALLVSIDSRGTE